MKNPPRTTKIRGQKHLLAYITPDEAKLLKAMGGSGEKIHGIPAFFDVGEGEGGWGTAGSATGADGNTGGETGYGNADTGYGYGTHDDASSQSIGQYDSLAGDTTTSDAETDDPTTAGPGSSEYDPGVSVFGTPEAERNWVERSLISRLQNKGLKDFVGLERDAKGRVTGYTTRANPFGLAGLLTSIFDLNPTVYTGFGEGADLGDGPDFGGGDGPDTVPAEYNPVTGQQNQCPDGYMFDEDLQACRMSADLPSFGTPITTPGPYAAGDYARMGLLDIAPMGMSLFADRYGIPQMDFDTANLAFRRAGATRPQYFRQAPNLTGYTLLS